MWGRGYGMPPFEKIENSFACQGEKPDAIFAINDALAITTIEKLRLMRLVVPDDVAVTGMGDLPIIAPLELTTVREPLNEIGCEAAEVLLELIRNPGQAPIHRKISCNELKIRKTA